MTRQMFRTSILVVLLALATIATAAAQSPQDGPSGPPRVIAYTGTVLLPNGQPRTGPTTLNFTLFKDEQGGVPLWVESQVVQLDERGRYNVWLGSQSALPIDLFQTTEARWLAVQPDGLQEQPRLRLLSVPYALKAGDAETLGGHPASDFLRSRLGVGTAAAGGKRAGTGLQATQLSATGEVNPNDVVVPDDQIVQGRICVGGSDCVNLETFGFEQVKLKAVNTRIKFEDTSAAGFPTADWQLTANDTNSTASGGIDKFSIENLTEGTVPFTISGSAATNSIFVDSIGRVGFRTETPVLDLHTNTSNTPAMRLEQNNSGGFTAQTWDMGGNEANFFIRDVTSGSRLPFRIRPGAPTSSIDISADGDVGIGTGTPRGQLDIFGATNEDVFAGMGFNLQTGPAFNYGYAGASFGRGAGFFNVRPDASAVAPNPSLRFMTVNVERMIITNEGKIGIGKSNPDHPIHLASGAHVTAGGTWTNASSRSLKDNIAALSTRDAVKAFARLKPVTFTYKADPNEHHVGFIAEDVPDLVATADRQGLASMDILAVVTKVVQKQQAEIADLKAQLARLEALLRATGQIK